MNKSNNKKSTNKISKHEIDESIQKRVAYYETLLSHSIASDKDFDKQILTLSALAIGLIAIINIEINAGYLLTIWIIANLSFLLAILFILFAMIKDAIFFRERLKQLETPDSPEVEKNLNILIHSLQKNHLLSKIFFLIGVFATVIFILLSESFLVNFIVEQLERQIS